MKMFWTKLKKYCGEVMAYAIAILILIGASLVPFTLLVWCIMFWIQLF
jgi:hypothetical protein